MRENELLNALAQEPPGVEIRMCRGHKVSVKTHYEPLVTGIGNDLHSAAVDCVHWIFDVLKDRPELRKKIPNVLLALEAYDTHTAMLRI